MTSTTEPTVIDTASVEWISGPDLLASMDADFVANLGARDEVEDAFSHYLVKPLLREEGGRRMDLAQFTPGYRDVTACYHRSAEEGFVIDGTFDLAYEGHFAPEHYFWRPPGWVHGTIKTDSGATAIFSFEGENDIEQSGPVTRTVENYGDAGKNALLPEGDPTRIGPRGYTPNVAGAFRPRVPGSVWIGDADTSAAFDGEHFTARELSRNALTGGGTYLLDLAGGYSQPGATKVTSTYHFFIVSGSISIGDNDYRQGAWVYVPAGVALDAVASAEGAVLYAKPDTALRLA
jgi:hypothetical protein